MKIEYILLALMAMVMLVGPALVISAGGSDESDCELSIALIVETWEDARQNRLDGVEMGPEEQAEFFYQIELALRQAGWVCETVDGTYHCEKESFRDRYK